MALAKYVEDDQHIIHERNDHIFNKTFLKEKTPRIRRRNSSNRIDTRQTSRKANCTCPFCGWELATYEALISHVKKLHGGQRVDSKSAYLEINGIPYQKKNIRLTNLKNRIVVQVLDPEIKTIFVKVNHSDPISINIEPEQDSLDLREYIENRLLRKIVVQAGKTEFCIQFTNNFEKMDLASILDQNLNADALFDEYLNAELSGQELINYTKLVMVEGREPFLEDGEFGNDLLEYCDDPRIKLSIDQEAILTLYWTLFKDQFDYSISKKCRPVIMNCLLDLVHLRFEKTNATLKKIDKSQKDSLFHQIGYLNYLLQNDPGHYLFYEAKAADLAPISYLLEALNELRTDRLLYHPSCCKWMAEFSMFDHLPLYQMVLDIIRWNPEYSRHNLPHIPEAMKYFSPYICMLYLAGLENGLKQKELKEALRIFPDSMLLKAFRQISSLNYQKEPVRLYREMSAALRRLEQKDEIQVLSLTNLKDTSKSSLLIKSKWGNLLLDCGRSFEEGLEGSPDFAYCQEEIDYVLITHAHFDHLGSAPDVHFYWPKARLLMSAETHKILENQLNHQIYLEQNNPSDADGKFQEEFLKDAQSLLSSIQSIPFDQVYKLNDHISVRFIRAGHMGGAAMIELWIGKKRIIYTGDFSVSSLPLSGKAEIQKLKKKPDLLISEGTFLNEDVDNLVLCLQSLTDDLICDLNNGSSILIGCSTTGMAQELTAHILQLQKQNKISADIPIITVGSAWYNFRSAISEDERFTEASLRNLKKANAGSSEDWLYKPEQKIIICGSGSLQPSSISGTLAALIFQNNLDYKIYYSDRIHQATWDSAFNQDAEDLLTKIFLPTHPTESELADFVSSIEPQKLAVVHTHIQQTSDLFSIFGARQNYLNIERY